MWTTVYFVREGDQESELDLVPSFLLGGWALGGDYHSKMDGCM